MTVTQLRAALKAMGIHNEHGLTGRFGAKGRDVWASYMTGDQRGDVHGTGIISASHKTDPEGPWYNHGSKKFLGTRAESMPLALAWAEAAYKIDGWATSPFDRSAKIPAEVLKAAREAVVRKAG